MDEEAIGALGLGLSGANNTASGNTAFWGGAAALLSGVVNGAGKFYSNQQNLNQQFQLQNLNNNSLMNTVKYIAIFIGGILVVIAIINKIFK